LAESVTNYSAETAQNAARLFAVQRFRTKFGVVMIAAIVVLSTATAMLWFFSHEIRYVGVPAAIISGILLVELIGSLTFPKRLANRVTKLKSSECVVRTTEEGFVLTVAGNAMNRRWSDVPNIWIASDCIVFGSYFKMTHIPTKGMNPDIKAMFEQRQSRRSFN